jgi:hypothetical protein
MKGVELYAGVEVTGEPIDDAGTEKGFDATSQHEACHGERRDDYEKCAAAPKEPTVTAQKRLLLDARFHC